MQDANMNKKVGNASNMTVTVMYSKYDVYQLSAVVGTEKSAKMVQSDRNVHMMVTGNDWTDIWQYWQLKLTYL